MKNLVLKTGMGGWGYQITKLAVTHLNLSRRPVKLPNAILKSALGLNSLWPNHALLLVSEILVNTDSGNGFLHDGTKPLPKTMWAYHQIDQ